MADITIADLDDPLLTQEQLAANLLAANFEGGIAANVADMESTLNSVTQTASSNCSVIGSVDSLVKGAYKDTVATLEKAIGAAMEGIGKIIKAVKAIASTINKAIQDFAAWLTTASGVVLGTIVIALKELTNVINGIFSAVASAAVSIGDTLGSIGSEMFKSVSKMLTRNCENVSASVKNIGSGAGIDSTLSAVSASTASFALSNTFGVKNAMDSAKASLTSNTNVALKSALTQSTQGITSKINSLNALKVTV
jgi:hypothetical protein